MRYLLDTNVISELRKRTPEKNVLKWFDQTNPDCIYLSCLSIGEITSGALKKAKTDKINGELLLKWVECLIQDYEEQIIDIDLETCEEWGRLLSIDGTNVIDSLFAAQAIKSNMIFVTRNIKHFKAFNIKLFDPFEDQ